MALTVVLAVTIVSGKYWIVKSGAVSDGVTVTEVLQIVATAYAGGSPFHQFEKAFVIFSCIEAIGFSEGLAQKSIR